MALPTRGLLAGAVKHQLLHGGEVIEHGPVRAVGVAPPDRGQDAPVILMRALGAATGEEALLAALPEEVDEGAHDPDDGAIVGSGSDGGMKGRVLSHPRASAFHLPRLLGEDPLHLADLLARRTPGGQRRDGRLEKPPRLEELPYRFPVRQDHQGQRLDEGFHGYVPDEGALSRPDLDEPPALERAQSLAHGRSADAKALGEQGLHLADDIFVDPDRLDGLELHQAWPGSRRWRAAARASHQPRRRTKTPSTMESQRSAALAAGPSQRWTTGSSVIISPAT